MCGDLCEELDDHALLAPALYRLSLHHVMRVDMAAGIALGDQLLDPVRSGATRPRHSSPATSRRAGPSTSERRPGRRPAGTSISPLRCATPGHDAALVRSVIEEPAVLVRNISTL